MTKVKNFGRKIFLVEIDSEWFETYFKTKISKSKIFSRVNFFSWDLVVFRPKWLKKRKNDQGKKFWSKIFLVGIDSECFETYFETKISKSKIFSRVKFLFVGLCFFWPKWPNSEKLTKSKNFGRNVFWSESIQNALKRILKQKSRTRKFFPV